MKIIADQNIPFVKEAFSTLGEVYTCAGETMSAEIIQDADILLVRSVTPVNSDMLEASNVKFVATSTIGTDHIDRTYLEQENIGFASAPGSNAQSVVEYVIAIVVDFCQKQSCQLEEVSLGIIGVGAIGSALALVAKDLGIKTLLCDPPRSAYHPQKFVSQDHLLANSDIVSLHVPLTFDDNWPTVRMVNDAFLATMKENALFINASRGRTMLEKSLLSHAKRLSPFVLDVWPEEPIVSSALLDNCAIATPHIAGYSFDGKVSGTDMIYRATCRFFNLPITWDKKLSYVNIPTCRIDGHKKTLSDILKATYDIQRDDRKMRLVSKADNPVLYFKMMRKEYPKRYEFSHWTVTNVTDAVIVEKLKKLHFSVI